MTILTEGKGKEVVNLIIPSVRQGPKLELRCPYCGRNNGNIHTDVHRRRISDTRIEIQRQLKLEGLEYAAKDMLELAAILRQDPMPQKIPESIEKLARRYINCRSGTLWKVNKLLQHIERTWDKVSKDGPDRTNNATERLIGLDYKIRAKTMRGFKTWPKVLNHCYLSEYLRGTDGLCDLRKVI